MKIAGTERKILENSHFRAITPIADGSAEAIAHIPVGSANGLATTRTSQTAA
jgi:hypothetical protein